MQCIRYGRKQSGSSIRTMIRIGLRSWSVRSSMSRHLSTRKMSSKSVHAFWVILLTDRQTNIAGNLPHPLSEGNFYVPRSGRAGSVFRLDQNITSINVYWGWHWFHLCLCMTEPGDDVSAAQKCGDEATTIDVKCTSLVAREDATAGPLTSGHVTANEHDHMVSSTIHSDGQLILCHFSVIMWFLQAACLSVWRWTTLPLVYSGIPLSK